MKLEEVIEKTKIAFGFSLSVYDEEWKIHEVAQNIAIAALEKQIPKKVEISSNSIGFCSECHGTLWQNKDESHYCFRCGQKIDWSVE